MKTMKKVISVVLSMIILITTSSVSNIAFADRPYSYIENGKYYRLSYGEYIECLLDDDYDYMIEKFQDSILSFKENSVHEYYATTEIHTQEELQEKIETSIFTHNSDNPMLGCYRFNSTNVVCSANLYPTDNDVVDGVQYYVYGITVDYQHSSTPAEEKFVEEFAKKFTQTYISEDATDFEKVKTIYDFVIRNTEYDYETFEDKEGKYPQSSDRFRISHSAYGAIIGNRLRYNGASLNNSVEDNDLNIKYESYDTEEAKNEYIRLVVERDFEDFFAYKEAVTGEKIVELEEKNGKVFSNGKSVCEGYSKLFCFLCVYNGIPTRIVDGDYIDFISNDREDINSLYPDLSSGKETNPHEWNYVWLDDAWYIVDTTFSSQMSLKNVDLNSYEYFLIGTQRKVNGEVNPTFSIQNHQQPYVKNGPKAQLYDWYDSANIPSEVDYNQPLANLSNYYVDDVDRTVIIERKTDYGEGEKCAYIVQGKDNAVRISIKEDESISSENVGGFDYNGKNNAKYTLLIPYLTSYEYKANSLTNIADVGEYTLTAKGNLNSKFDVKFNIVPIDMSNGSTNYSEIEIDNFANYTGQEIEPLVSIIDGYKNRLTTDDYRINVTQNGEAVELIEMGNYDISIDFKGNYCGSYLLEFTIGKIDLSTMTLNEYALAYIPKSFREKENINNASDLFKHVSNLEIGTKNLILGEDYTVSSTGSISSFGDTGTLTISAVPSSRLVQEGTQQVGNYKISEKFDISGNKDAQNGMNLNNQPADSNSKNKLYYDGTAKKPTTFDNLEKTLEKNKDYKIVSYSNNVNAGKASVVIEGINGCTGKATMYFNINPANITKSKVTTSFSGSTLNVKVVYNGKTLVKDKDYTQSISKTSTGYLVTIQGKGNYAGTMKVNCSKPDPTANYIKPTASGNKVKLSKTSYVYNGKACKPTVTLVNRSGKKVNSYYYTVKYSSNVKVGTAKVTLTFRNGYKGSMSVSYKIIPKATTLSKPTAKKGGFKLKWKKQTTQTDGYQIQYSTSSKFSKSTTKTKTVKKTSTSLTVSKLKKNKTYYVRIRTYKKVGKSYYYSSWSTGKVKTKK